MAAGNRTDDFLLDLDEVKRVLTSRHPVITFLCSPNNPTGRADSLDQIKAVATMAPGLVVVDEAYGQFAPSTAVDFVRSGAPGSERTVVVRTFSKTWSMAGLRLGYLIGPSSVVDACEMVALPYHLDAAKQLAGRLALRFTDEMETTGGHAQARSGAASPPHWPSCRWRPGRRMPTSSSSDPPTGRPPRCGTTSSLRRCSCETVRDGRGSPGACGSPWASRWRTTGSWPH